MSHPDQPEGLSAGPRWRANVSPLWVATYDLCEVRCWLDAEGYWQIVADPYGIAYACRSYEEATEYLAEALLKKKHPRLAEFVASLPCPEGAAQACGSQAPGEHAPLPGFCRSYQGTCTWERREGDHCVAYRLAGHGSPEPWEALAEWGAPFFVRADGGTPFEALLALRHRLRRFGGTTPRPYVLPLVHQQHLLALAEQCVADAVAGLPCPAGVAP